MMSVAPGRGGGLESKCHGLGPWKLDSESVPVQETSSGPGRSVDLELEVVLRYHDLQLLQTIEVAELLLPDD